MPGELSRNSLPQGIAEGKWEKKITPRPAREAGKRENQENQELDGGKKRA